MGCDLAAVIPIRAAVLEATTILAILPMAIVAAVLHVPVAWLLRRLYRETPFREALGHYEKQIQCTPYTGPEADHPHNHGLQALTLRGLWQHFEGFILEYDMHFVVANLVKPLTQSKGVSFVTLWGGQQVDYFVSHSWGTGFRHFVRSIQCHALSKEGPGWTDAAYWICSFANNQWNLAAELGPDPMSSAFARVLTAGPKEVAMVLDQEGGLGNESLNRYIEYCYTIRECLKELSDGASQRSTLVFPTFSTPVRAAAVRELPERQQVAWQRAVQMPRQVSFSVKCADTRVGLHVRVVGSVAALGEWDPHKGIILNTSAAEFPNWKQTEPTPLEEGKVVEYKYVICDNSGSGVGSLSLFVAAGFGVPESNFASNKEE
eukprot:Skav219008  [mRNA]  locus=scaffold169:573971:596692:+ [translate_table: standard]